MNLLKNRVPTDPVPISSRSTPCRTPWVAPAEALFLLANARGHRSPLVNSALSRGLPKGQRSVSWPQPRHQTGWKKDLAMDSMDQCQNPSTLLGHRMFQWWETPIVFQLCGKSIRPLTPHLGHLQTSGVT